MTYPEVFAFGLVAFGMLGMGPVTIAVDSYGPVTDNAQSVFELSTIEQMPGIHKEVEHSFGFKPDFETGKHFLEANDGAGNTFKATAKPMLIGTAVVGATTMIFSLILMLKEHEGWANFEALSITNPWIVMGMMAGGSVVFWFCGASMQGRHHRRLPRGRVHQEEHQARRPDQGLGGGQQRGRAHLHGLRAKGHDQHLRGHLLAGAGLRVCEPGVFHRLSHRHRALRPLRRRVHGQCGRLLGQRQEARRSRIEAKGHAAARLHGRRRPRGATRSRTLPRWPSTPSSSLRRSLASSRWKSP